jgi:amino acid permease
MSKDDTFTDALFFGFKSDADVEKYFNRSGEGDKDNLLQNGEEQPEGEENNNNNKNNNENLLNTIKGANAIPIGESQTLETSTVKTLRQRLFSKIDAGSIRGSIFNLSILSLGSGCLALPQKFGQMSMLVAIIDIIIAGIAAYWTLNILIQSADKYKIHNYSILAEKLHGKWLSLLLDITILVYIFGIMVLYQVICNIYLNIIILVYKLIGGVVNDFGNYGYDTIDNFFKFSFWSNNEFKFPIMYGVGFAIILPLCLLKDISKMRFTSIFGVLSLMSLILIIIIEFPWYLSDYLHNIYKEDDPSTHLNLWNISTGFTSKLYFFQGTATLFYAYSCHIGAFPIYKELKNNVRRRIEKVFTRSIILDASFYLIVGVTGYLSNPLGTPDLIIERYKLFDSDIIMTLGRIAFVFTLIMKIPANYNSFRLSLLNLIGYDVKKISNKM